MPSRVSFALLAVLALAGCAASTPPPRFHAVSPADPQAPESVTPPAAPALTGGAETKPAATPTPTPTPHHHHGGQP